MNDKNDSAKVTQKSDASIKKTDTTNPGMTPEDELVYRLKTGMDNSGRFKFALNDMAMGLAVGSGVTHAEARKNIEDRFAARMGQSPLEYLDRHYAQRKQNDLGKDNGRGRGR